MKKLILFLFAALLLCGGAAFADGTQATTTVSIQVVGAPTVARTEDFTMVSDSFDLSSLPADVSVVKAPVTLSANAEGYEPLSYQWALDGVDIPGATESSHIIATAPAAGEHSYTVTVTDGLGQTTVATINVLVSDEYAYATLADDTGAPTVTGYVHNATILHVDPIDPQTYLDASAWAVMSAEIGEDETYTEPYNVYFTNSAGETIMYHGTLNISFGVGAEYNDQTLKVVHYHEATGAVETIYGTVVGGALTVTVHDLCPFLVVVPEDCTVTATAGAHGSISPAGAVNVAYGGSKTFTFLPDSNYIIDSVLVDGSPAAYSGNSYTFTDVTEDHTIAVSFRSAGAPPVETHTVNISSGAGGSTYPTGQVPVEHGSARTIYFYPDKGYELDAVLINGVRVSVIGGSYTISAVTADTTVSVSFKKTVTPPTPLVPHTVTIACGPGGSVSPAGSVTVYEGGDLYIYFIPDEGYELDAVTLDGTEVNAAGNRYHLINIVGDRRVYATFIKKNTPPSPSPSPSQPPAPTPSASPSAPPKPSPSPKPPQSPVVTSPAPTSPTGAPAVTVSPVASPSASGQPATAPPVSSAPASPPPATEPGAVSPTPVQPVTEEYVSVTVELGSGGSVSPSGELSVPVGGSQTFYFYPDEGYEVEAIYVNGDRQDLVGSQFTVEGLDGDTVIRVTFRRTGGESAAGTHCFICRWLGGNIAPWCWLAPLLIALILAGAVWYIIRRRREK